MMIIHGLPFSMQAEKKKVFIMFKPDIKRLTLKL